MEEREPISWNERHGGLFEPDVILPAQFFRTLRGREAHGGERRLILAVLEDAINCFQKNLFAQTSRGKRLFREAEHWVMSVERDMPFAFENICEFLSFDAECIRQGLCRWARAATAEVAAASVAEVGARRGATTPVAASATRPSMAAVLDRTRMSFERPLRRGAV